MAQRRSTTGGATAVRPAQEDGVADGTIASATAPHTGDEPEEALGYEAARDQLIEVVRRLEAGGITLEESLALWERGERLASVCQRWLDGARARLEAVTGAEDSADGAGVIHD